jgi:hypothetical protein
LISPRPEKDGGFFPLFLFKQPFYCRIADHLFRPINLFQAGFSQRSPERQADGQEIIGKVIHGQTAKHLE